MGRLGPLSTFSHKFVAQHTPHSRPAGKNRCTALWRRTRQTQAPGSANSAARLKHGSACPCSLTTLYTVSDALLKHLLRPYMALDLPICPFPPAMAARISVVPVLSLHIEIGMLDMRVSRRRSGSNCCAGTGDLVSASRERTG